MSYMDEEQRLADYEWDEALRAARDRYNQPPCEPEHETVRVMMQDGLTDSYIAVGLPVDLGRRMNALHERLVNFYRHAPGPYWPHGDRIRRAIRHNYVLTARLPDGRRHRVEYPPRSGQFALDRVAALVEWAEQEMGITP